MHPVRETAWVGIWRKKTWPREYSKKPVCRCLPCESLPSSTGTPKRAKQESRFHVSFVICSPFQAFGRRRHFSRCGLLYPQIRRKFRTKNRSVRFIAILQAATLSPSANCTLANSLVGHSRISPSKTRLATGAEYKCTGPKTSSFLFFASPTSYTPDPTYV